MAKKQTKSNKTRKTKKNIIIRRKNTKQRTEVTEENTTIRIVERKGKSPKSRQGPHIIIKTKGIRASEYKYDEDTPIDDYFLTHKLKIERKKGTRISKPQTIKKAIETGISKKKKLGEVARKFAGQKKLEAKIPDKLKPKEPSIVTIDNCLETTQDQIRNLLIELMLKKTRTRQTAEKYGTESTARHYMYKMFYEAEIINDEGQILATIKKQGMTPKEIIIEIQDGIKTGETLDYEKLKNKGWTFEKWQTEGKSRTIQRVKLKITFIP